MARGAPPRYNSAVETLRVAEYPMIKDSVYLDHAGTTLCPKSLVDKFAHDMTSHLYGNPHSASSSSQLSTCRIQDIRLRTLQFLGADPDQFDLVFVANATAGIKLVAEAMRALEGGFDFLYHQASHTSVVGIRGEAEVSACLDDGSVEKLFEGVFTLPGAAKSRPSIATLFAYTAQSNFDGRRYSLDWADRLRRCRRPGQCPIYTLLDAASFASTSPLQLSDAVTAPDFVVLSFYKIFGFPDLGALLVRRQAWPVFQGRKYFGGGTVDMVVSLKEQWHAPKTEFLHERLEDGTLPIHSILALGAAMDVHQTLYGTMYDVGSHTTFLAQRLHRGLQRLKHSGGEPVCVLYSRCPEIYHDPGGWDSGPIVTFNVRTREGAWVSLTEFEKLAGLWDIHVRTGSLCNPGGTAKALSLEPWEMKRNFSAGIRCGTDSDIVMGKPGGVIRASIGAMNTLSDVEKLVTFVAEFFRDGSSPHATQAPSAEVKLQTDDGPELYVKSLTIYPIKSCAGYSIPRERRWEVRPEGMAWDREWCLLHRGSGQALSQKKYPRMALIKPAIDFGRSELVVEYHGEPVAGLPRRVSVPLSRNPGVFREDNPLGITPSRVCGEEVSARVYHAATVNDFFSIALQVPCVLARFPPGGQGIKDRRTSKARVQIHQIAMRQGDGVANMEDPLAQPGPNLEIAQQHILLSNESPILVINQASVQQLRREIRSRRGDVDITAAAFRANVVLTGKRDNSEGDTEGLAYAEEGWRRLVIGKHAYTMLGACRRCQMVCVDQETGRRGDEPFSTLSKTRRFNGKVFFGVHMGLEMLQPSNVMCESAAHAAGTQSVPTIQAGDRVFVEAW